MLGGMQNQQFYFMGWRKESTPLPVLSDYDICLWNGENKCGHDALGTVYFLWLVYADAAGEPGAYGVDADRAWGEYRVGRRIAASDELVAAISAGFHAGDGGGNRIYRGGIKRSISISGICAGAAAAATTAIS